MKKIVWAEGIFLGQQHLQAWDQQLENNQQQRQRIGSPFEWGLISMSVDHEALAMGRFRLLQIRALFQDGRFVEKRNSDNYELACELSSPGGDPLAIYLAVPANQHVAGISGYPQRGQMSGWIADYNTIEDLYDGNRVKEVLQARPNLMLMTDQQALGSFLHIKIAEVVHRGDNRYQLVTRFVPPTCRIAASPTLVQGLERIIETLNAKRKQIEAARKDCDGGVSAFAERDPNNHALLRNLNTFIPQLRHLQSWPDLHPEQLYRELCMVAGAFCTFQDATSIDTIPSYDHSDLTRVFSALDSMLSVLLELKTKTRTTSLDLVQESPQPVVLQRYCKRTADQRDLLSGDPV